jgi:hypothetical protein
MSTVEQVQRVCRAAANLAAKHEGDYGQDAEYKEVIAALAAIGYRDVRFDELLPVSPMGDKT